MTILRNTAEGGTVGVAPTVGNSGGASGDAFTVVTTSGTSTITVDNAHAKHGTKAYKIVTGGTSETVIAGLALSPNATVGAAQCYLYMTAYPTTQTRLMQFTTAAGAGKDAIAITSAGKLRWDSFAGTDVSMAMSVPLNTWVRISMVGNLTSCEARLFTDVESTTAAETLTGLSPLSGDTFAYIRFGWTSSSIGFTAWYDTVECNGVATLPSPFDPTVAKSDGDTSGAADAGTLSASLTSADTNVGADAAGPLSASLTSADTNVGTDATGALSASLTDDQALAGTDASALSAGLSAADTAGSTDDAGNLAAAITDTEGVSAIERAWQFLARTWHRMSAESSGTSGGVDAASSARSKIENG